MASHAPARHRAGAGGAMYVTLLRHSLDEWSDEPSREALLEHVLSRRFEMLVGPSLPDEGVYSALATEVGYDRALIKLSLASDIHTSPEHFTKPAEERRRLERALVEVGIDLSDLARGRA